MDSRSKKLCLVSHCLLNCNSKVDGACKRPGPLKEVLYALIDKEYGIIQLPCPEMMYGLRRWGHAREQFDHPFFREQCRQMLRPIITQVVEYRDNGYSINYVLGVNGSPSCGVDFSCSSGEWMGEISRRDSLESIKGALSYAQTPGIFMEELIGMLKDIDAKAEFIGIRESRIGEYDFAAIFR